MDSRRISDEYFNDCPNTRLTERRSGILNTVKPNSNRKSKIYCNNCSDIDSLVYCGKCEGYFCNQCYILSKNICTNCNKSLRNPEYVSVKSSISCLNCIYRYICCIKIE